MNTEVKTKTPTIFNILLISALIIYTFSFSLSFYDGLIDGGIFQILVNLIYTYRDICLFSSLAILILFRAFPLDSIILVLSLLFAVILSFVVNPENAYYFKEVRTLFILCIDTYLITRSNLVDLKQYRKILRIVCYCLSVMAIITFLTNLSSLLFVKQYMDYSNSVSIVSALLLYFGLIEGKKIDLILGLITYILLLIAGSRGSFITLSLLIVFLIWLKYKSKIFIYVSLVLGIIFLCFADDLSSSLLFMSSILENESRTIDRLLSADLLYSNDRYQLYIFLLNKSFNDSLFGGGICADRNYLDLGNLTENGFYAHNIFIELITDFGIFALPVFIYFGRQVYVFIKEYHNNEPICGFVIVYFFVTFVQLLFSRSWLTETNLFFLIALLKHYNNCVYGYKTNS